MHLRAIIFSKYKQFLSIGAVHDTQTLKPHMKPEQNGNKALKAIVKQKLNATNA